LHRPATFSVTLVALPGVDGIKAFRALLKAALRHYGLRAIDVRQCAPDAQQDERARSLTRETTMSAFSERIRSQKKGLFKVADLEGGKELTLTISHLDEEMEMFGKTVDILNFQETGQQLQLNFTTAEFLLDNFGDDPSNYADKKVTLYLANYEYNRETKLGIRLKLPGLPAAVLAAEQHQRGDGQTRVRPERKADLDDEIPF
jgi:hypothetical protein